MHTSLDQALGRQPRLNRVGQSLLNIASGASAAYSLRSLTGDEPKAVRIRRDGDNEERDFTTAEIETEAADWTNGKQETTLPADVATSAAAYSLRKVKSDYTGPAVRIRRLDDVEVNVSFDTNDEVSINSPVSDVIEEGGEEGNSNATNLGNFIVPDSIRSLYNQRLYFDGSNDSVSYSNASDFALSANESFELSFKFVYVANANLNRRLLSVTDSGGGNNVFEIYRQPSAAANAIAIMFGGDSTAKVNTGTLKSGKEYLIKFGYDGSSFFCDLDGERIQTSTESHSGISPTGNLLIGARHDGALNGSGVVSDISFSKSGSEIFSVSGHGISTSDWTSNQSDSPTISGSPALFSGQDFSAFVHTWYDQSGNSKNATQTTDANQPLIAEGGSLLTAGLKFDGTDDFLATGQSVITQSNAGSFSYFAVSTIATDEGGYLLGSAGNGSNVGSSIYAQNDSKFSLSSGFNLLRDNITRSSGENLLSACYTGGRANFRVDGGGTSVTAGTFDFNANANFTIANRENGSSAATFLAGSIKEIIAYDSDQTNNRFKIESNINNYYTIYTAAQNGFVNTWYDQSGNGFNAVADADANEPKIVNSGSLLTDGLKFSLGNNLKLSGTGLDIFKNISKAQLFYAIKINDTSANTRGFFEVQTGTNKARFLLRNSTSTDGRVSLGGRRLDGDSFSSFQSDSGHSNEKIVLTGFINYSDAEAFIFQNGTQIASRTSFLTAGATSDTRSTNAAIGRTSANNTAEFDAEELIIFNTDQTANRTAIETNIANEYGITLS